MRLLLSKRFCSKYTRSKEKCATKLLKAPKKISNSNVPLLKTFFTFLFCMQQDGPEKKYTVAGKAEWKILKYGSHKRKTEVECS